jgi:hypothetical protein
VKAFAQHRVGGGHSPDLDLLARHDLSQRQAKGSRIARQAKLLRHAAARDDADGLWSAGQMEGQPLLPSPATSCLMRSMVSVMG